MMKRLIVLLLILVTAPALAMAAPPAFVQYGSGSTGGTTGTSLTATSSSSTNMAAGHGIAIALGAFGTIPTVSSISTPASDVIAPLGCGNADGDLFLCVFYIDSAIGGDDAVSATLSTSVNATMVWGEYSGVSNYILDFSAPPSLILNQNPFVIGPNAIRSPNTTYIGFGWSQQGSTTTYSASGYTARGVATETGHGSSLGLLDSPGGPSCSYQTACTPTLSITGTSHSVDGAIFLAFRSINPPVGTLQWAFCSSGSSSVTSLACPLPAAMTVGHMLIVDIYAGNDEDNGGNAFNPVPSAGSDTFVAAPAVQRGAFGHVIFYVPAVGGGETSVTVNPYTGGSSQVIEIYAAEVTGVVGTSPVYNGTRSQVLSGSIGTLPTSPFSTPVNNYFLFSSIGDLNANPYTGTAGYNSVWTNTGAQYIRQTWEEVASSGGTQQNSPALSGTANQASAFLLAFAMSSPNLGTRVIQVANNGGSSGTTQTTPQTFAPVSIGNEVILYATWAGAASTPILTESLGNTFSVLCGGTSSDFYGLWIAPVTNAGIESVVVNPTSQTSAYIQEVAGIDHVDASTCAANSSASSIAAASVTTSNAGDYVEGFAGTSGACGPPALSDPAPPWVYRDGSSGHCANTNEVDQLPGVTGAYGVTWTTGSNSQLSSAMLALYPSVLVSYRVSKTGNVKTTGNAKIR